MRDGKRERERWGIERMRKGGRWTGGNEREGGMKRERWRYAVGERVGELIWWDVYDYKSALSITNAISQDDNFVSFWRTIDAIVDAKNTRLQPAATRR